MHTDGKNGGRKKARRNPFGPTGYIDFTTEQPERT
jgi:hypothetical protein